MTEAEWLVCDDPAPMLDYLRGNARERKLRLFACACVRRSWSHLTDERIRRTLAVAERDADSPGSKEALWLAEREAKAAIPSLSSGFRPSEQAAAAGAMAIVNVEATEAARLACGWARNVSLALKYEEEPGGPSWTKEKVFAIWGAEAVALLLCTFGNPFRPATIDSAWLTWNGGAIPKLAQTIYDERAFDRMPMLADALLEAGCTNEEILTHCSSGGEHVRGCWVVDLVLGKE
jgi:hypothetical protein